MIDVLTPTADTIPESFALPASLLHDMRTPLNQIIGYSELLLEQARDDGMNSLMPDISKVRSAGGELLTLINEKFSSSTQEHTVRPVEFRSQVTPIKEEIGLTASDYALTPPVEGTILVVDDSESNRDLLVRRLSSQGYTVAAAENGRKAMEMVAETDFDLVLLDIMMPEMDGFEVLKRLKSDERMKHIPVIMISALSETESAMRCIEMGAEDYLQKPFDPTLLKARTTACLKRKRGHDKEILFTRELQQSYRRTQELERMRDDLTNMIVHDLRTPLTSVISGMQTMGVVGELDDRQRELLDISLSGGRTLLGMINDLLDINKIESGSLQLNLVDMVLTDLVSRAIKQVCTLAASKNVEINSHIEDGLPCIFADSHKLLRTLVNLLSNAIKFTSPGGDVTIEMGSDDNGNSLRCSVSDSGEGIPAHEFERIFEKFGQVETRKAGRTYSTGLGLTLCKLVVEAHGGRIWVESDMDSGSTFIFTIPLTIPLTIPFERKAQHAK